MYLRFQICECDQDRNKSGMWKEGFILIYSCTALQISLIWNQPWKHIISKDPEDALWSIYSLGLLDIVYSEQNIYHG